eukprot:gene7975-8796_t
MMAIPRILCGRNNSFPRVVHRSIRLFSSSESSSSGSEKVIYEGKVSKRLRTLKRISVASSLASVTILPLSVQIVSGMLPIAAQVAMAGTIFFTSLSSTAFLQLVASPYVCRIVEITNPSTATTTTATTDTTSEVKKREQRRFRGTKLTFLGGTKEFEFTLADISKPAAHPFGSCQLKGLGSLYVYGGNVLDKDVRTAMTKD